ncbi:unknown [Prevotella sp. CAG:732]|nr:unknown [Prevotella sp. CAG:732]
MLFYLQATYYSFVNKRKEVSICKRTQTFSLQFDTSIAFQEKQPSESIILHFQKAVCRESRYRLAVLVSHNAQYHIIGGTHGIRTNGGQVVDALIHIVIDDTLCRSHALAFHRQESGKQSRADT